MNDIKQQKKLLQKAISIIDKAQHCDTLFSGIDDAYAEKLAKEYGRQYADTMNQLFTKYNEYATTNNPTRELAAV